MRNAGRHAMPRGHDEYVAKMDPKSQPGEWRGKFVPKKQGKKGVAQKKKAAAAAAKLAANPNTATDVPLYQ